VHDLPVAEGPRISERLLEFGVVVGRLVAQAVDRDKALALADDALELDLYPVGALQPSVAGASQAVDAAVALANVIGQVRVLVLDLVVEEGDVSGSALESFDIRRDVRTPLPRIAAG
jgi:hypothetical protein